MLTIVDGPTIAAGESLSDGADCSAGTIVRTFAKLGCGADVVSAVRCAAP